MTFPDEDEVRFKRGAVLLLLVGDTRSYTRRTYHCAVIDRQYTAAFGQVADADENERIRR